MRVVLLGSENQRGRLRQHAGGATLDIVGEFATFAAARAASIDCDAYLVSSDSGESDDEPPAEPLTTREVQVLELLAEGLSNKAIAERLAISDQTVKFHVASVSGKLGAHNRTEAVRRAVRRGLITL